MITDQEFKTAADIIGCEPACIKAVYEVEAAGSAYLPDGRVKILFEGHRFWKQIAKSGVNPATIQKGYENVLYQKWDRKQYKGGTGEWDRMSKAIELCKAHDLNALLALNSASYGSFQIMGENFIACGYPDSQAMLAAYNEKGESEMLYSFVRFVKANHLDDELRDKNWPKFAEGYNGSQYKANNYDKKLFVAYTKYSK